MEDSTVKASEAVGSPAQSGMYPGLTSVEAKARLERYGKNELAPAQKPNFFKKILRTLGQPMFLLLLVAATVYFLLGEPGDGAIMLVSVAGIITIQVIQEWKTDRTLEALKDLSAPRTTVIRDGKEQQIPSSELVPGDLMLVFEGVKIPADGWVIQRSDLQVDESSLTGESVGVWKTAATPPLEDAYADEAGDSAEAMGSADIESPAETAEAPGASTRTEGAPVSEEFWRKDYCYAGTLVLQGSGFVRVQKTGAMTEYGKIGSSIVEAPTEQTPLERQTGKLVLFCAFLALGLFILVSGITFIGNSELQLGARAIESVLAGVTIAMAMIPEEYPVVLTVYLSMGAWRLAKHNSLVRKMPAVETLGSVSVLCVDKTGTITENRMAIRDIWCPDAAAADALPKIMGLACEVNTYDPMEVAMLEYCEREGIDVEKLQSHELITEYPFTNVLKMMGHVWQLGTEADPSIVIAAKGSPESILPLCSLNVAEQQEAEEQMKALAQKGLRIIAVGKQEPTETSKIPSSIKDASLSFLGIVGLADPPREGIDKDIAACAQAGIKVVMITGDNGVTAQAIAGQVGIPKGREVVTGTMLDIIDDETLRDIVEETSIFSRVIPEHKMRIVSAYRENGEVVAMTGDGVNDAPALTYADVGIAMGKRGSEVSREAADLILLDDNFSTIVGTIKDGRRIYDNIRKAVGYLFSIHIPIALTALVAPLLGVTTDALMLLPLHVVLLELIIDPTCAIIFERQPAEPDTMRRPPRKQSEKLVTAPVAYMSIFQGLALFAVTFGAYWFVLSTQPENAVLARSMGLAVLILSNIMLVLVSSSHLQSIFTTFKQLRHDKIFWLIIGITIAGLLVVLYSPINTFLRVTALPPAFLLTALALAVAATLWFEIVKYARRRKLRQHNG